ncbi:gamma-glutamylcyclotransferase family protein [Herminiimonas sp. NPDC097707]|uniref:gamma-glutamylcyclotransferase family protein n=1 Tax=Herminiimonas sp. NPDC097707 TaxID=3364007 RepID=UPI00383B885E
MHIFTYGSLMFPEIWQRIVRGDYRSTPATAHGYVRYVLTDDTYPGMIVCPKAAVEGVLYLDVTAQDVAALDAFEGSEYRRALIDVVIKSEENVVACTYIFMEEERLSSLSWEPQAFQISRFIDAYCSDKLGG